MCSITKEWTMCCFEFEQEKLLYYKKSSTFFKQNSGVAGNLFYLEVLLFWVKTYFKWLDKKGKYKKDVHIDKSI